MQLHHYVNLFGQDLKRRLGERVHKLTLHGAFSCPNRDGTLGRGGCTFCNVASFSEEAMQHKSIQEQLDHQRQNIHRAKRYLAYFQAYTNTYAEVEQLRNMYQQALSVADIAGLCVGTRPDCVPDEVLQLLAGYQMQGYEIWLELGLQTAQDKTLQRINRGHDFAAYQNAVERAHRYGLKVCTHLIVGLPGEGMTDYQDTLARVVEQPGCHGIKLHPLHIVTGSKMAQAWQAGRLQAMDAQSYIEAATSLIQHTPSRIVYHRVSAMARQPTLLAPLWCADRWRAMVGIGQALAQSGAQGSAIGDPFVFPHDCD
ncbi:TIGR01212 family radical SAM protein [Dongshaea marina]|uniref:TIGR01212 family radical SAM protein n=1 Tax=Dongshaea marina TaxID=2047966 RepID=UPI000D3E2613|nr:TIGR01212 family radical SAM protein [Dongshaea marina]